MKNLLLLIAALCVSALCAELAARRVGFVPRTRHVNEFFLPERETTWSIPDSELGWINRPGTSIAIGEDPAPMTFWDHGRRASRGDAAVPAGDQIPVMIVGGSDAQSYGVRDEDSFAFVLAERFPQLWVENFGTGGYGTVQAEMMAERAFAQFYGADRKPRLIVLTLADSHVARNVSDQSWVFFLTDAEGRYVAPPHYLMRDGNLVYRPFRAIGFWPLERQSAILTLIHATWLKTFVYDTIRQGPAVTRAILDKFIEFADAHNALLAVAVLVDDSQSVGDLLQGKPVLHTDCSALQREHPGQYLMAGNGHPNRELHAHYAACIGDWLERDIIPKLAPR